MSEQVNHPSHYQGKIECIDAMVEQFGMEKVADFCEINAFKYLWRAGDKEGNSKEQDEQKAMWYLRKNIELRAQATDNDSFSLTPARVEEIALKNKDYFLRRIKELKGK